MKRIVMKSLKQSVFPVFMISLVFLLSCGGGGAQRQVQEEKLTEVKESVSSDLYDLRRDIMERIAYVEDELDGATGETQEVLEESRGELQAQLGDVEKEIENVREASLETWDSVIQQVNGTVSRVREKRNEISLRVRELIEE